MGEEPIGGVTLHAGVRIGRDVVIGDYTVVYPNAVIYDRTEIGARVIVHAGAVIGSDGYGFVSTAEGHRKVPHIGHVQIGDDVEIGAGVTIDRATCGATRIGRGTKIGNLSQVAHNVQIGEDCLIVGMRLAGAAAATGSPLQVRPASWGIQVGDRAVVGAEHGQWDAPEFRGRYAGPRRQENLRTVAASRNRRARTGVRHLKKRLEELEAQLVREGAPLGEAED